MAVSIKICKQCNKDFEANEPRRKYCSHECQQAFLNANRKGKCINCGKEFRGTKRLYCTDECKESFIPTEEQKLKLERMDYRPCKCAKCGKEWNGLKKKYCSDECRGYSLSEKRVKPEPTTRKCKYCGKEFIVPKSNKKFCDKSCSALYRVHVMGIVGGFGK